MSDEAFKPVNFDAEVTAPVVRQPEAVKPPTPAEAVERISEELTRMTAGTSKLVPHAITVRESSSPFLAALRTFKAEPTPAQALVLIEIAKQDYGARFGTFVESLVGVK